MSNKRILVVEDDADVRLGYHVFLKAHCYDLFLAADGVSAVSQAAEHRPDLIILDLGLPAGDGFIVLDWLRVNTGLCLIPVIVVSARDIRGNRERAFKAGVKAYFQKPWDDNELLATIKGLVGQSDSSLVGNHVAAPVSHCQLGAARFRAS
jgi:DNA-binding response OmpR family regulator